MWPSKSLKSGFVVEVGMQKGGAEFRFVLWDLGVHVLCLPSLPGEGPSRLCEKLLTGNRADCGEQWGCGLGTLLTLWERFPGEGQVVSQEGGSCVPGCSQDLARKPSLELSVQAKPRVPEHV